MEKAVIYGTGIIGRQVLYHLTKQIEILGFCETEKVQDFYCGLPVYGIAELAALSFDKVIIASTCHKQIKQKLNESGVGLEKITDYWGDILKWNDDRIAMLRNLADEIKKNNIAGDTAELGVYQGNFAQYINELFPDRKLYLFDTFCGFDEDEMVQDVQDAGSEWEHLRAVSEEFRGTSEKLVLSKMCYPDSCIIKKGYFPGTAEGLDARYCFVSIDVDLYPSIKAGLEYFWPRLLGGGYLMVHDFNAGHYPGVRKAVVEFSRKY